MPIGLVGAALIGGTAASAGTSLAGSWMQSRTANKVAKQQADAATRASSLLQGASDRSLQDITAARDQAMNRPDLGGAAASSLLRPEFMNTPEAFRATNASDLANDPGYQFRLEQGQKALDRSAASRGTLNTGGTLMASQRFGQQLGSQEFGNVDARRFRDYQSQQQGVSDTFGRLSGLLGFGQNQDQLGFNYASLLGNTRMAGAGYGAQGITDASNALGAGRVAGSNAWGGTLSGIGNNLQDLSMLYAMRRRPPAAGGYTDPHGWS